MDRLSGQLWQKRVQRANWRLHLALSLGLFGAQGCDAEAEAPTEQASTTELLDLADWRLAEVASDPFPEHRPGLGGTHCDAYGLRAEYDAFEVRTEDCPYALVAWTLQEDVLDGDPLRIVITHGPLLAETPADAHLSLSVGGLPLWSTRRAIPHPPGIIDETVIAPRRLEVGEAVVLHLHNHGSNAWTLRGLSTQR